MTATDSSKDNPGSLKAVPDRSTSAVLEDILDELHRLADAAESLGTHLDKWDRDGVFYAVGLWGETTPALGAIHQRLHELGTLLNLTPEDTARLGLAQPGPLDLDGIERSLEAIARSLADIRQLVVRPGPKRRPESASADEDTTAAAIEEDSR